MHVVTTPGRENGKLQRDDHEQSKRVNCLNMRFSLIPI